MQYTQEQINKNDAMIKRCILIGFIGVMVVTLIIGGIMNLFV